MGEEDSWVYQRVYGVLWILETLWYTWVNETPGRIRGVMGFSGFFKALWYVLRKYDSLSVPNFIVFA